MKLHVWTVDDEEEIKFLNQQGIDAIITNKPVIAKKVRLNYWVIKVVLPKVNFETDPVQDLSGVIC